MFAWIRSLALVLHARVAGRSVGDVSMTTGRADVTRFSWVTLVVLLSALRGDARVTLFTICDIAVATLLTDITAALGGRLTFVSL